MQYLKKLILAFPFFERVADQSCIADNNGTKYERLIATRGNDYMLVYNYTGRPMKIDLSKIHGKTKKAWWYSPRNAELSYIGEFSSKVETFQPEGGHSNGNDWVLILTDGTRKYIEALQ